MNSSRPQIQIPPRELATHNQVATLLGIVGSLYPVLVESVRELGTTPPAVDGGVVMAASQTFARACDRLDRIIGDESRWQMGGQDTLEKEMRALVQKNIDFLEMQTEASRSVTRPSFKYRPGMLRVAEGWVAILGDIHNLDQCIVGVGASPEAALENFDKVFTGQHPPDVAELVKQIDKYHETLDRRRDETPQSPPPAGRKLRKHRRKNGMPPAGG